MTDAKDGAGDKGLQFDMHGHRWSLVRTSPGCLPFVVSVDDVVAALAANPEARQAVLGKLSDDSPKLRVELEQLRVIGRCVADMWQRMGRNARAGFPEEDLRSVDIAAAVLMSDAANQCADTEPRVSVEQAWGLALHLNEEQFAVMNRYIAQREADAGALRYWSTRARELEQALRTERAYKNGERAKREKVEQAAPVTRKLFLEVMAKALRAMNLNHETANLAHRLEKDSDADT